MGALKDKANQRRESKESRRPSAPKEKSESEKEAERKFEEAEREYTRREKEKLTDEYPSYQPPTSKKPKGDPFKLDRGNSIVEGDGDKVTKRFKGSKKLQEKLVQEEFDKATEMLKQFDGAGAPVIKRDKDGTPYLEYEQLEKVKDLDKKEMEKAFKQV
jgi:hypothetical protein